MKNKYSKTTGIIILAFFIGILIISAGMNYNRSESNIINKQLLNTIPVRKLLLYVGSYTPAGKGIYIYSMNSVTGSLKFMGLFPDTTNPSYLAVHPNKKWLFSVSETGEGAVSAYRIIDSATIELINTIYTKGKNPCYLSIDNSGKYILASHYQSGSVVSLPIKIDGSLGNIASTIQDTGKSINDKRQAGPHAHCIVPAPEGNLFFSADLGTDFVYGYKLDTINGKLTSISKTSIKPGSGPRHLTFHPNKKWMYLLNELSGTVEGYLINKSSGKLEIMQTLQVINDIKSGATASDIHIGRSGKFLYAAERDPENTITVFSIDLKTGFLNMVEKVPSGGMVPRNFAIDPAGKFLVVGNQKSDNLTIFSIDNKTGKLTKVGIQVGVQSPACVKFMN